MIPRAVQMTAEVANTLTASELNDYGNIILSGYLTTGPNTINKKAYQWKETLTPPVNLPSLTSVRPALKSWTQYQEYYTQLQPNGYGVNPGDPTMFEYSVHSYTKETGPILRIGWISPGSGYTNGTYLAQPLTGGTGSGATANIIVSGGNGIADNVAVTVSLVSTGDGYPLGNVLFTGRETTTITGIGYGLTVQGMSANEQLLSINNVTFGGLGYQVGDTYYVSPGTGVGQVDTVTSEGRVTSFTIINPGTGYTPGDALEALGLPLGSGFYAPVSAVDPVAGTGNVPRWSQPPYRYFGAGFSAALYPKADNLVAPPIDIL